MESITISRLEVHNDEETKVLKDDNSCTNLRVRFPQIDFSCVFHLAVFVFWKNFVYQKFWKKFGIVTSKYACNSATFVVLALLIKYN